MGGHESDLFTFRSAEIMHKYIFNEIIQNIIKESLSVDVLDF